LKNDDELNEEVAMLAIQGGKKEGEMQSLWKDRTCSEDMLKKALRASIMSAE
jgi:ribonuclease PH